MLNHISCADCIFAREDGSASKTHWKAYECGNPGSENYKALLNVTSSGTQMQEIISHGCKSGRRILS